MEIVFEKKCEVRYRESVRLVKRIQESAESVVPDTEEDIGRIAAVQSSVLLKSKDLSGRGVLVTGEARASVLCIDEGRERISCVRLAKPFSAEFEVAELSGEEQTQISLAVAATDARLLNPRKLSVTFDPVCWTVHAGERLRLDVASADATNYYVHPNCSGDWRTVADCRKAVNRLHFPGCHIELPIG